MSTSSPNTNSQNPSVDETYPEQRHAGKVGYGPNFKKGATFADRITGLAEEIHGKIAHNPQLAKEGHDKYTGDAARRKALGLDDKDNPFAKAGDEDEGQSPASETPAGSKSDTSGAQKPPGPSATPGTTSSISTGKPHTSDISAKERAATITPRDPAQPPKVDAVEHMKSID